MDIPNKIQGKLTKILKKLKSFGIIQTFTLEMTFCQLEENVKNILIEIDTALKKCLRKLLNKPRKAEIRNIIAELVRKKNLNNIVFTDKPIKNTVVFTKSKETKEIDDIALKFQCGFHKETFNSERNLNTHKKKHEESEKYLCEKCGNIFYNIQDLMNHHKNSKKELVVSTTVKNLDENTHSKIIKNNNKLKLSTEFQKKKDIYSENLQLVTVKEPKCPEKINAGNEAAKETEAKFICHCGKIFQVLRTLKKHERTKHSITDTQHKCIICGKCFIKKGKLNRHLLSHSDFQYSCSFCLKQFSRSDTLKRHISLFHFTSRKFICNFCQKKFSLKYNRDVHEENVHKNVSNRVQCDYCGNKFKNKTTLKIHFKTHFKSKITCMACRKSFSRKSYFKIHVKNKHFGVPPCALDSVTS